MAGDGFAAGLLHRIGQIVMTTSLPNEYGLVIKAAGAKDHPLHEEELNQLGITSNQVGAYLLGLWGMPLPLVEAAALYPTPSLTSSSDFTLLTAVHVANVLSSEEENLGNDLPLPKMDREYLSRLGLPWKTDAWRKLLDSPKNLESVKPANPTEAPETARRPPPQRTVRPQPNLLVLKCALVVAAVVLVAAAALWRWQRNRSAEASTSAAINSVSQPTAPTVAPSAFDTVRLEGIFYRADRPTVVINGKNISPGQTVDGVQVVSIEPTSVILESNGERRTISLR
jgi:hypothetical protein